MRYINMFFRVLFFLATFITLFDINLVLAKNSCAPSQKLHNITTSNNKNIKSYYKNYLWCSALDILSFIPLTIVDIDSGLIVSDWYYPSKKQLYCYKIQIIIKSKQIHPSSLDIKIFEKKSNIKDQECNMKMSNLSHVLERIILLKAREVCHSNVKK